MTGFPLHDLPGALDEPTRTWDRESGSLRSAFPRTPWDERLIAHIDQHVALETNVTNTYEQLAEIGNPQIKYLADLIVADEHRHHEMLSTLTASVAALADEEYDKTEWTTEPPLTDERRRLLRKEVRSLLAAERRDVGDLKDLRRDMRLVPEETMWLVIVEVMACDAQKHVRILKAITRSLRHPSWS